MKYWEEIKDRVSIRDVVTTYTAEQPNHAGFVCCPLHHEKTPSMKLYDKSFYCYGCHEGGNAINFVMKYFNLDFKSACVKISDDFNLNLPIERTFTAEEKAKYNREQHFKKWKENYIKRNVDNYEKLKKEIEEYLPLFYRDTKNLYYKESYQEINGVKFTIPYTNFKSELIGDEDFDYHLDRYDSLVRKFENLVIPTEEQLRNIYNSTGFYINN